MEERFSQSELVERILNNTDPIAAIGIIDWRGLTTNALERLTTFASRYTGKNRLGARLIDAVATEIWTYRLSETPYDLYSVINHCFNELYSSAAYMKTLKSQVESLTEKYAESDKALNYLKKNNEKVYKELLRTRQDLFYAEVKAKDRDKLDDRLERLEAENERLRDLVAKLTSPKEHWSNANKDIYVDDSSVESDMTYEDCMYSTAKPKAWVRKGSLPCNDEIDIPIVNYDGESVTVRIIS